MRISSAHILFILLRNCKRANGMAPVLSTIWRDGRARLFGRVCSLCYSSLYVLLGPDADAVFQRVQRNERRFMTPLEVPWTPRGHFGSQTGSAFCRMNSSTSIPSMVGGRRSRFIFPWTKMVMNSWRRRFFAAFSASVSFRFRLAMTPTLSRVLQLVKNSVWCPQNCAWDQDRPRRGHPGPARPDREAEAGTPDQGGEERRP
jgi:hypothetical protein